MSREVRGQPKLARPRSRLRVTVQQSGSSSPPLQLFVSINVMYVHVCASDCRQRSVILMCFTYVRVCTHLGCIDTDPFSPLEPISAMSVFEVVSSIRSHTHVTCSMWSQKSELSQKLSLGCKNLLLMAHKVQFG